jgi:hypothetical protein
VAVPVGLYPNRGCRRFADTPGRRDQRDRTPKAFPWERPDAFACNVAATSNAVPVPTATPLGSGAFGRVTGGRGEAPQPPAVNGNRFAIGLGVGRRVRHAEGVFVESRGCRRFADTPG